MTCKFVVRAVPTDPHLAFSPMTAEVYCATHNMPLSGVPQTDRCPIGRIEDATTSALAAINLATDDAISSVLDAKG